MIQLQLQGPAYGAGFQCGQTLKQQGIELAPICMQGMNPLRFAYSQACCSVLQQWDNDLVDEIKGMADGQEMSFELLCGFLFGMYAFPIPVRCSCLAMNTKEGVIFGRNSDFAKITKDVNLSVNYAIDGKIPFLGNTTFASQVEDGVNVYGLAVGLTFIPPVVRSIGFNAGFLVRYLLEHCHDVEEALEVIVKLPIGSGQTLTLADSSGKLAVIECNGEKTQIHQDSSCVYAVNHFNLPSMRHYNVENIDDLNSALRYQTLTTALQKKELYSLQYVKEILMGEHGYLCQKDQEHEDTVWSSLINLNKKEVYRCEGNPSVDTFLEEKRLTFIK